MTSRKSLTYLLLVGLLLVGLPASLHATYYLDTLFPIGLTGLNNAGRPPFSSYWWKWTHEEDTAKNEQDLIFDLGINVIGCQDAKGLTRGHKRLIFILRKI